MTPRNSFGIRVSHSIFAEYLSDNSLHLVECFGVRSLLFLKNALKSKVLVCPVHYWWLMFLGRLLGKRVIFFIHGTPTREHYGLFRYLVLKVLIKISISISDKIIVVSKRLKAQLGSADNTYVFYNVLASFSSEINLKENFDLVFWGRVHSSKGLGLCAKFFYQNRSLFSEHSKFLVYGEICPAYKKEFEELLEQYSFIDYKGKFDRFSDIRNEVRQNYFISANYDEPFGIVYIEAIQAGCLPIIPYRAGASEVISGACIKIDESCLPTLGSDLRTRSSMPGVCSVSLCDDRAAIMKIVNSENCGDD